MNKNIIAISGTQGTGKSYLAYRLCTYLRKLGNNVIVFDELARECPFPINKEADDVTQIWLATTQVARELEKIDKYDYIVVDRSVLDSFAYGLYLASSHNDVIFSYLKEYLVRHIKKYYLRLYLLDPIAFNFNIEDGVRDTDPVFRIAVHNILVDLYTASNIDFKIILDEFEVFSDITSTDLFKK